MAYQKFIHTNNPNLEKKNEILEVMEREWVIWCFVCCLPGHKWIMSQMTDTGNMIKHNHKIMLWHSSSTVVDHTLRNTTSLSWQTPVLKHKSLNHHVVTLCSRCSAAGNHNFNRYRKHWPSTSCHIIKMLIKTGIILVYFNDVSSSHPIYDGTTWLCVSFHSPGHRRTTKNH